MSVLAAGLARAASPDERIEALFRPPLGEWAALSPDGHRVAYTQRNGGELTLVMMSVEPPSSRRTVVVEPARDAAETATAERPPPRLRFLRWATDHRLVYAPDARVVPLPPITDAQGRPAPNPDGPTVISPIFATDFDGRQRGALVDARDFQEAPEGARRTLADFLRTPTELSATRKKHDAVGWRMPHLDILGFFPRDRDQLIIATRGAYSMPLRHLVDIRTGNVQAFGDDWPAPPGEPHIYDWHRLKAVGERHPASALPATLWRDDDLAKMQAELEKKFPRRAVELLDWSETRARALVRVTGGTDPGRVFVWQRTEDILLEAFRRAPWLVAARLHETRYFEFAAADGARLGGWLTWPAAPRTATPPLVVVFPAGFPGRAQPAFDPEAQVLADLGFAVARLNHRAVAGVREQDRETLRAAIDRAAVDDARAAIAWLAARPAARAFDRRRVAALGHGLGGYLALRALQLAPAVFRGGVALGAPLDPRAGLIDDGRTDWKKFSVLEHAEMLTPPVLLLADPAGAAATADLCARLQRHGRAPARLDLDAGFAAGKTEARAAAYRKIGEFLTLHLHGQAAAPGAAEEAP